MWHSINSVPLRGAACLHQTCIGLRRMTVWVFYICAHACLCSVEILFVVWCTHANACSFLQWHICEWELDFVTDENGSDCQGIIMQFWLFWRFLTDLLLGCSGWWLGHWCVVAKVFWFAMQLVKIVKLVENTVPSRHQNISQFTCVYYFMRKIYMPLDMLKGVLATKYFVWILWIEMYSTKQKQ